MCKVLLKQQNGSDDFYLVILKKEIAFFNSYYSSFYSLGSVSYKMLCPS